MEGLRVGVLAVVGWAVLLGAPNSVSAYRTAAELPELQGAGFHGWVDFPVAVHVQFPPAAVVGAETVVTAVQGAARLWTTECGAVSLTVAGAGPAASGDGVNSVSWFFGDWQAAGYPADRPAFTAVTYEQASASAPWTITEFDIVLNGRDYTWSAAGLDLPSVIGHEMGHALGFLHVCEPTAGLPCGAGDADSALFPTYGDFVALSDDDVAGVCDLYPGCETTCADGTQCRFGECVAAVDPPCSQCRPDGDACDSDQVCRGGLCIDGLCTRPCTMGCPPGWACDGVVCQSPLEEFGGVCSRGAQCTSGRCIIRAALGTCTRHCSDERPCPSGFSCDEVDGERVCAAPAASCQAGPPRGNPFSIFWFVVALVAAIMGRQRFLGEGNA